MIASDSNEQDATDRRELNSLNPPCFRRAIVDDAGAIVAFQLAMAWETEGLRLDATVCAAGVRAVFDDPSRGTYFVAELNQELVGSVLITLEWSDWRNGPIWWLQSVYVRPAARNCGVFKGLYRHVQSLVERDSKVRGMRLYVDRENVRAQDVYRRLGMNGDHYQVFEWMKSASGSGPSL